ncbi:MAG: tRNA-specific adenosine deaminase [Desulfobulbaceae bacterium C00003063]|nr:MAG: tRNA-specific adenosine deaminase [Desulfobulbaceae bacterium C00003063]
MQKTTPRNNSSKNDEKWMGRALAMALEASRRGEVPVGAVLVMDDMIIGEGGNSPIGLHDPTAHAEIIAIRNAAAALKNYRLPLTTLYVTLEPCIMCMGAILHARIDRLVYGASDPKSGAVSSVYTIGSDELLNHYLKITGNILEQTCSSLLKDFFKDRRKFQKNRGNDTI